MQRTFIVTVTLTILIAVPALAQEVEKKDNTVQRKPPPELRIDHATPGLIDTLTVAPMVYDAAGLSSSKSSAGESSQSGVWIPAPTEQPKG